MNRSMPGLPVRHQLPEFIKAKQTVTSMKQIQFWLWEIYGFLKNIFYLRMAESADV